MSTSDMPDLDWYTTKSKRQKLSPRCPFADAKICPKYADSYLLLDKAKIISSLSPAQKARLRKTRNKSPPTINEEAPTTFGPTGKWSLNNMCPEVGFEANGYFASSFFRYSDDIDRRVGHAALKREGAPRAHPGWLWQKVIPQHYTECRMYSVLLGNMARRGGDREPNVESAAIASNGRTGARSVHGDLDRYFRDPNSDTLRRGMRGPACANLKKALSALGYRGWNKIDEQYDAALARGVRKFQTENGHPNKDGRVGPGTRRLLVSKLQAAEFDFGSLREVFDYDVALSFAGEDRKHAHQLATCLKKHSVRAFYDKYEEATLWGKDLYVHLHEVYSRRARFCIIFVSENYAKKLWTSHERTAAQERALRDKSRYILPIRLDETEIPGLPTTIGYINIDKGIPAICDLVVKTIARDHAQG